MKQKILFVFLCIAVILGLVSCDSLWKVNNNTDITFSVSKDALMGVHMASSVRSIDSDDSAEDGIKATIALYYAKYDREIISKTIIVQDDVTTEVLFENLEIIGETVYAKIEAIIDGVTYVGTSETKVMLIEGNALEIGNMERVERKVATPVITKGEYSGGIQTISITCETEGAQIFYAFDGSDPIDSGIVYLQEIRLPLLEGQAITIKAYATKTNLEDSDIAETTITTDAGQVMAPIFSYSSGNFDFNIPMQVFTSPSDATIYYTMDGSDPTRESTSGNSIDLTNAPSPVTVKAFAVKEGMIDSEIVSATWYNTNQDRFFTINDDGIITAYDSENGPANVVIPATIKGTDVKGFEASAEVFMNNAAIESVTIPEGVEEIRESAFAGCTSLTSIAIPSSVENIGANAFSGCSNLATATIPDSVDTIGANAFANTGLTTVYTDAEMVDKEGSWNKITNDALFNANWIQLTDENLFTFENGTITDFDDTKGVTNVVVPSTIGGEKVVTIGSNAFNQKQTIESIVISEGIANIEGGAFFDCPVLSTVYIPSTVASIEAGAFAGAASPLTAIHVSSANSNYASQDGVLFSKVGNELSALEQYPRAKTDTEYSIPDTVKTIKSGAFYNAGFIEVLTIPASVASIGSNNLNPSSIELTAINVDSANANYESIDGVLFTKGLTTLIAFPHDKATQDSTYTIPAGVEIIGESAFQFCEITEIAIPNTVTTIEGYALNTTSLVSLNIPSSVSTIGEFALSSITTLMSIIVDSGNSSFMTVDGVLYTASGDTLILCPVAKTGSLTALATVKTIASGAFRRSSLTDVILPEGLTAIEGWSFSDANASVVNLPATLTHIGNYAFSNCSNLTEITLYDSVTTIEYEAFGASGLTTVYTNATKNSYPNGWNRDANELFFNATWEPIP